MVKTCHIDQNTFYTISNSQASDIVAQALSPCISDTTNEKLISTPSPAEVQEAMLAIHPNKASRPDRFSASFFQSNWSSVGPAITWEIQSFFSTGHIYATINATHWHTLGLFRTWQVLKNFRAIDLLPNKISTTKLFLKLLALRLKPLLQDLRSENQSAFIHERAITVMCSSHTRNTPLPQDLRIRETLSYGREDKHQ